MDKLSTILVEFQEINLKFDKVSKSSRYDKFIKNFKDVPDSFTNVGLIGRHSVLSILKLC